MAAKVACRFCSDLVWAFFRHCSARVRFCVVDASIPITLPLYRLYHLFGMAEFMFMFLACAVIEGSGSQCLHRQSQILDLVFPHWQMAFRSSQLGTGGTMGDVWTGVMHGQMGAIARSVW